MEEEEEIGGWGHPELFEKRHSLVRIQEETNFETLHISIQNPDVQITYNGQGDKAWIWVDRISLACP